jgi:hypothetical protein
MVELSPDLDNLAAWKENTAKCVTLFRRILAAETRTFWATLIHERWILASVDACLGFFARQDFFSMFLLNFYFLVKHFIF